MTPIEAAVKAGRERRWHTSYGLLQFSSIDARAIIRAFLEAAAMLLAAFAVSIRLPTPGGSDE